jgi:hypothetical protein
MDAHGHSRKRKHSELNADFAGSHAAFFLTVDAPADNQQK